MYPPKYAKCKSLALIEPQKVFCLCVSAWDLSICTLHTSPFGTLTSHCPSVRSTPDVSSRLHACHKQQIFIVEFILTSVILAIIFLFHTFTGPECLQEIDITDMNRNEYGHMCRGDSSSYHLSTIISSLIGGLWIIAHNSALSYFFVKKWTAFFLLAIRSFSAP